MRSSTVLALLGATLAVASPVHQALHANHAKKAYAYDIVTDVVYVTITEGELSSTSSTPDTTVVIKHTVYVPFEESSKPPHTKSSSTYVPPPPPSSTYVPPPPPTTTSTPPPPPPPPTTTQAPAPVPTTTEAAPVVVATQEAAAAAPASSDPMVSAAVSNHNTCRSSHSAPAVTYNETLAQWAANTASTCVFAHDMTQGTGAYGQNIAAQGSSSANAWTAETAVENAIISEWYSEESLFSSLYNLASPSGSGDFLHFTQVVWVGSTEIGCAVQACPTSNSIFPGDYTWFTVCNYYPQGNVEGEFNTNVLA